MVTFDATPAALQTGGIGRVARELADRLAAGRHRERFRLVAAGWGGAASAVAPSGWRAPSAVAILDRAPRRHRARLIARSLLGWADDGYWGRPRFLHSPDALAPRLAGAETAVVVHDLSFRLLPHCHTLSNRLFLEAVVPRSVRRAAVVFADSEVTRRDLAEHMSVPTERVCVLYPGVGPAFAVRDRNECRERARREHALAGGFVLTVGTVEPRKNHAFLLAAFAALMRRGYEGRLVVVGRRGWGRVDLERSAAELGVAPQLTWLERVSDESLAALYGACDAVALPSLYEGFGLPAAEAMACGAPLLVSDRGSLPEVVGDAAAVVPIDDPTRWAEALSAALGEESVARARRLGPERAARFRWEAAVEEIERVYDEWLGRAPA